MQKMIAFPHVKVNLGLEVLRRRPDGFHDIRTVFVPYRGLHDTLEVIAGDDYSRTIASLMARYPAECIAQAISPDGRLMVTIARREGVGWEPLSDLTAQAYMLLSQDFRLPAMKIFLEKTSPVGAGLGGGSSDAASALRLTAAIAGLGLTDTELSAYAARLGSDCAFFVYDRPMLGEGRGEILTPIDIPDLDRYDIEVVIPQGVQVSTKEAYSGIVPREAGTGLDADGTPIRAYAPNLREVGDRRKSPSPGKDDERDADGHGKGDAYNDADCHGKDDEPDNADGLNKDELTKIVSQPVTTWKNRLVNDFEKTIFHRHPELAAMKARLYERGAAYAAMSGSGSALFGLFPKDGSPAQQTGLDLPHDKQDKTT